ncbi:MAG: ribonuclease, partial [Pseudonocardiales bacterium]|nr:ribonuclease [Pseudonocardiales bacterium]
KTFTATAVVAGRELGTGMGRTKKEAEQKAAQLAWRSLSEGAGSANSGTANSGSTNSGTTNSGTTNSADPDSHGGTEPGAPDS